jgi:hypothetical protein
MNFEDIAEDHMRLFQIFSPAVVETILTAESKRLRLVHYTSADTATKIIEGKSVWLRKANCMNDFSEVEHGLQVLACVFKARETEIRELFDGMFDGVTTKITTLFDSWQPIFRDHT